MSDRALAGSIDVQVQGAVARVVVNHAARFNAMTRSMWRQLAQVFAELGARADLRCVVLQGQGDHFCAGGDISEYPSFRFQPRSLRQFHEEEVWGGLRAMLACDVPLLAQIESALAGRMPFEAVFVDDQARNVSDVGEQKRSDTIRDRAKPVKIDDARVSAGAIDLYVDSQALDPTVFHLKKRVLKSQAATWRS